ncbi:MAG: L,D-transpeptidase family protein, partial [Planctomycetes bacterium]|nr:L,D-transpeptidase family protein [Planctomycetota bacterium]
MNTFKSLLIVAVLGVVAYGTYALLTGGGRATDDTADEWAEVPRIAHPEFPKVVLPETAPAPLPAATAAVSATMPTVLPEVPTLAPPPPLADMSAPYPATPLTVQPLAETPANPPPSEVVTASGIAPQPTPNSLQATPAPAGPPVPAAEPANPAARLNPADFPIAFNSAQAQLTEGRPVDALESLSIWYGHPGLSAADQQSLVQSLDYLAGAVIYSRLHVLERAYEVQPGDTLDRIAQAYEVPWELLAKINGVADPQRLRAGDLLKVLHGPFNATIELDQFRLTMWLRGMYAGRFTIGIGQDQSTPTGEFSVLNKVVNPTYYGPQVVDADDPTNPLGEHWIDLGNRIGIHGTIEPQTIGRAESRGCIRLLPNEVQDVFDMLAIGS